MNAHTSTYTRFSLMAGAIILISACATMPPPAEELALANASVTRAASAGGTEAAASEMRSARDKLDRAKIAMGREDYPLALSLAEEAQVDAQLAEVKARSVKARKAADELQEGVRVLREELDRKAK